MGGVFSSLLTARLTRVPGVPEQEFFPILGGEYPNESCVSLKLHLAMSDIMNIVCRFS